MSSKPVRAPTEILSQTKQTGVSIVHFVFYHNHPRFRFSEGERDAALVP